jgi:hypothetical protein
MIDYEYTMVNRLDEPHQYMYTKFEGHDFLNSYFDNRKNKIERFQEIANNAQCSNIDSELILKIITHLEKFIHDVSLKSDNNSQLLTTSLKDNRIGDEIKADSNALQKIKDIFTTFHLDKIVNTEELLNGLLVCQLAGVQEVKTKEWLDRLVQRFEVSKKLYESYLPGFRKGNGSSKTVYLYWLFSLSLCLFYISTGSIKYLSTQLKISDLLCSLSENHFHEQVSSKGMSLLLLTEIKCVKLLTQNISGDLLDPK